MKPHSPLKFFIFSLFLFTLLLSPDLFSQITLSGGNSNDQFGWSLDNIGDIDGDGYDDTIIGTWDAEYAQVYSGQSGAFIRRHSSTPGFGWRVTKVGNLDNDGVPDYAIVQKGSRGTLSFVHCYSGATGTLIRTITMITNDYYSEWGFALSSAGDLNNDGYDEIIVGAYAHEDPVSGDILGRIEVFSGADGAIMYAIEGEQDECYFGHSVGGGGDVNNDGYNDFIVGAPYHDSNNNFRNGAIYVYSGLDGSLIHQYDEDIRAVGRLGTDFVGIVGDINNDGHDDYAASSAWPLSDLYSQHLGAVNFFSGIDGTLLADREIVAQDKGGFGYSCESVDFMDVNNDDQLDCIISKYEIQANFSMNGEVWVYSGEDSSLMFTIQPNISTTKEYFGRQVSFLRNPSEILGATVIISAPRANGDTGEAHIYSLPYTPSQAIDDHKVLSHYESMVTINVLANDIESIGNNSTMTITSVGAANNGLNAIVNNKIKYSPNSNWVGNDSFTYTMKDSFGIEYTATVTVEVTTPTYTINNMIAGQYANFKIENAKPNSVATIAYSLTGNGPTVTGYGLADLSPPIKILARPIIDSSGKCTYSPLVPIGASGLTFYTQALCSGGTLSNSLSIQIQ